MASHARSRTLHTHAAAPAANSTTAPGTGTRTIVADACPCNVQVDWQQSDLAVSLRFTSDSMHVLASMADMYTRLYTISHSQRAAPSDCGAASSSAGGSTSTAPASARATPGARAGTSAQGTCLVAALQYDEDDQSEEAPSRCARPTAVQILSGVGGLNDNFVVTGTPGGRVNMWNRESGKLLCVLRGHSALVNVVAFNPVDVHMMVSASDDHTMRVWTSPAMQATSLQL